MGLLENLSSGKYNLILIGILFVFVFHQYWNKNLEPMADVTSLTEDKVKELIYKTYLIDVTAIKNLSDIATELNNKKDGLTIPGDVTIKGNLNLLPRGTIVAYNQNKAPEGWTLCDGSNGSPNLTNKFILGWGNRGIGSVGGEENVTLGAHQMPQHNHNVNGTTSTNGNHNHFTNVYKGYGGDCRNCSHNFQPLGGSDGGIGTGDAGNHEHTFNVNSSHAGGNQPHNNMPPFYVLTYIMKL